MDQKINGHTPQEQLDTLKWCLRQALDGHYPPTETGLDIETIEALQGIADLADFADGELR